MLMSPDQKTEERIKLEPQRSCYCIDVEALKKKVFNRLQDKQNGFTRLRLVSTLHASGVVLDYLMVYIVEIYFDTGNKFARIGLSRSLGFTAFALRSLFEILNIIIFCTMFNFNKFNFKKFKAKLLQKAKMKYMSRLLLGIAITRKEFRDFLMFHQFLSLVLVAVVWQAMLMISLNSSNERMILITLFYLVGLHLPRLCAVIAILLKRPKTSLSRFRTKLLRLFFFVFLYSIQFFAALCYLTATYKETQCWNRAEQLFVNQTDNIERYRSYCSTNTTEFEFGIYTSVHRSGIMEQYSPPLMILYFSRWALQYLSSFAQGLEAGASVWQNIFIIFIIVYAVFMFFFLIGEVQSEKEKFIKLKPKLREKEQWMEMKKLPKDLQSELRKNEVDKWSVNKDVNIEDMFNNLPKNVSGKLSQKLCLERIKKVEEFGKWSEASLEELCDYIKPVFYAKGTRVIREGDPIEEMIFVVQGVLWSYPSGDRTMGSPSTNRRNRKIDHLKEGDFNGKELANWVWADPYSFNSPISKKSIQAVTNVEAFILMVYDLKNVFIKHQAVHFIQLYWRFKRVLRLRRNAQIPEQEPNTLSRQFV